MSTYDPRQTANTARNDFHPKFFDNQETKDPEANMEQQKNNVLPFAQKPFAIPDDAFGAALDYRKPEINFHTFYRLGLFSFISAIIGFASGVILSTLLLLGKLDVLFQFIIYLAKLIKH